jgi:predicted permease
MPLAERRDEIEADLGELFESRRLARGARYASRRYYGDVISLWRNARGRTDRGTTAAALRASALALLQDLDYATRLFRRNPVIVTVVVAGLGVAIGVGTSVFSLLNSMVLRQVGIVDPANTVRVLRGFDHGLSTSWPFPEYQRLREASTHIELTATVRDTISFGTQATTDTEEVAYPMFVTGNYFSVLNDRMTLGRALSDMDDRAGAPPVMVLSHAFWQRRLGGDPTIIGRDFRLNGSLFTVVGVAEQGFRGTTDTPPSLWAPLASYHLAAGGLAIDRSPSVRVQVLGRLRQGPARAQAEALLSGVAAGIGAEQFDAAGQRFTHIRFAAADRRINRSESAAIALVFSIAIVAILLIVLVACVNVAQLLLASAVARQRELGVRLALGASRGRLRRQLLTESVALGIISGAIGLMLTIWLVPILAKALHAPAAIDFSPDPAVYLFLMSVSILAGVGAGLIPARRTLRHEVTVSLQGSGTRTDGTPRPQRVRGMLIGLQAAVSLVLLVMAALLTRGMVRASAIDVGFDAGHLLAISSPFTRGTPPEAAAAYWDGALARAIAVPDVVAASLSNQSPFGEGSTVTIFTRGSARYTVYQTRTTADYFTTLGLGVVRGRTYTREEVAESAHVAVVSDTIARDFFVGEDPIGQRLDRVIENSPHIIIGVVANAITARLRELGSAAVYTPLGSFTDAKMLVRTTGPPEHMIHSLRTALLSVDSRMQLDIQPVSRAVSDQLAEPRRIASLAGVLAGLALALAVIGMYGVTAFVVGQRRKEISVRMAVGASAPDVVRWLVRDSLRPVLVGLTVGLIAALGASRIFSGALYGLSSLDPVAFGGAMAVLLAAAACAVIVPARRAAVAEPASLLREL